MKLSFPHTLFLAVVATGLIGTAGPVALRAEPVAPPLLAGEKDCPTQPQDAETIRRLLAAKGTQAWFIQVVREWNIAPPPRRCTAYLQPERRSARMRRGRFVSGESPDGPAQAETWKIDPPRHGEQSYAQVSLANHPFTERPVVPDELNRPFRVSGKISDQDIVALVDYLRTSPSNVEMHPLPSKPGEPRTDLFTAFATADGKLPISNLSRTGPDTVEIVTEQPRGSGEALTFRKVKGRWKVIKSGIWFA